MLDSTNNDWSGGDIHNKLSILATDDNQNLSVPHYTHSTRNVVRLVSGRSAKWHDFKAFHKQDLSCDVLVKRSLVYLDNAAAFGGIPVAKTSCTVMRR
jgi:hypothetical protein